MKFRKRIIALIIENKKLLLVKGRNYSELWTPGGKQEPEESDKDTLERELKEEVGLKLISMDFYKKYKGKSPYNKDVLTETNCFFAKTTGTPKPNNEIEKIVWYSKKDFLNNKYPMISENQEKLIPNLISDGFL
jgi:8-oxo-dGTP diphosphatase